MRTEDRGETEGCGSGVASNRGGRGYGSCVASECHVARMERRLAGVGTTTMIKGRI